MDDWMHGWVNAGVGCLLVQFGLREINPRLEALSLPKGLQALHHASGPLPTKNQHTHIHPTMHPIIHPTIHPSVHSPIHTSIPPFIPPPIRSFTHIPIHPSPPNQPPINSLPYPSIHPTIHPS